MHETISIVGDIGGRFDELMELLAAMPAASLVLSVGDLNDRGSKSRQVIEWFMGDPAGRQAVHGNHENMMLEAYWSYPTHDVWFWNGGDTTINSYGGMPPPEEHLRWLANRPMWYRQDGLFVSHAPVRNINQIPPEYDDWKQYTITADDTETSWIWNRYLDKRPMPGHLMLYGHNSHYVEHTHFDENGKPEVYAICLDDSRHKQLMGMAWPSREIFTVDYHA